MVERCAANVPMFVCSSNVSKRLSLGFCGLDLTHGTRNLMSFVHSSGMGISETDGQSTMQLKGCCESRMESLKVLLRMATGLYGINAQRKCSRSGYQPPVIVVIISLVGGWIEINF